MIYYITSLNNLKHTFNNNNHYKQNFAPKNMKEKIFSEEDNRLIGK